jgi:hypothetical protein
MKYTQNEAVNAFHKSEPEAASAAQYIRTKLDFNEQSSVLNNLQEDMT